MCRNSTDVKDALPLLKNSEALGERLCRIERARAEGLVQGGVGEVVPKVVVWGEPSEGKRAVWQAVVGVPGFGGCAKFPAEVVWRDCDGLEKITAKIRVDEGREGEARETLRSFRRDLDGLDEVPRIIEEASSLINTQEHSDDLEGEVELASDALCIEVTGPIGLHLCAVDLPGPVATSEKNWEVLHRMAARYLLDHGAIILLVLQEDDDIANHDAVELARQHDPDGQRTVVVVTKTDLTGQQSEDKTATMVKQLQSMNLGLNYFFMDNPNLPGQPVDKSQVGADQLRRFLNDILDAHAERRLRDVCNYIKKKLADAETQLKALGDPRVTLQEIRSFMIGLSMRFRDLSHAAVEGNYNGTASDPDFFVRSKASRLRAHIECLNIGFARLMRENGLVWPLGGTSASVSSGPESTNETAQLIVSNAEVIQWVKQEYPGLRGKELPGSYNPAFISGLFRELSGRWPEITTGHVRKILDAVLQWMNYTVSSLTREEKPRREMRAILQEWLSNAKEEAMKELDNLIGDERRRISTYNHAYSDAVQMARSSAQEDMLQKVITFATQNAIDGSDDADRLASAINDHIGSDIGDHAFTKAYVEVISYYKIARGKFVDNVASQVIERHITSHLPDAFSPLIVSNTLDDELVRIGSESEQQIAQRARLASTTQRLRQCLADLQNPPVLDD